VPPADVKTYARSLLEQSACSHLPTDTGEYSAGSLAPAATAGLIAQIVAELG
jgi:hypothetical protein